MVTGVARSNTLVFKNAMGLAPPRTPPVSWNVSFAAGYDARSSSAATEMAPSSVEGEPTKNGCAPSFPAATTTVTPAVSAALIAACSAPPLIPYGEPRERLITLAPRATAFSIPSAVSSVPPLQPNTRMAMSVASGAIPGAILNVETLSELVYRSELEMPYVSPFALMP